MYMSVYIYVYVYINIWCIYIYILSSVYAYICIYTYMSVYVYYRHTPSPNLDAYRNISKKRKKNLTAIKIFIKCTTPAPKPFLKTSNLNTCSGRCGFS